MPRNNSVVGSVVGLLVFVGFGVFFLFGIGPFRFLNVFPFIPIIFIICIICIAGAASVKQSSCCTPKPYNQNRYYAREIPRSNPYNVKTSNDSVVQPIYIDDTEPEKSVANFCQYCGTRKDRNAIYCHNCGTKL